MVVGAGGWGGKEGQGERLGREGRGGGGEGVGRGGVGGGGVRG